MRSGFCGEMTTERKGATAVAPLYAFSLCGYVYCPAQVPYFRRASLLRSAYDEWTRCVQETCAASNANNSVAKIANKNKP